MLLAAANGFKINLTILFTICSGENIAPAQNRKILYAEWCAWGS